MNTILVHMTAIKQSKERRPLSAWTQALLPTEIENLPLNRIQSSVT